MSRHGYIDDWDGDQWELIRWQGAVKSAIRGRRGQALLKEMRDALDAMPIKELIAEELITADGECCALGCVALARGMDVSKLDPEEPETVAKAFNINEKLVREITYQNDEWGSDCPPARRWEHVRAWVEKQIIPDKPPSCEEQA